MEQVIDAFGLGKDFAEPTGAGLDAGAPIVDGVEPTQALVVLKGLAAEAAQTNGGREMDGDGRLDAKGRLCFEQIKSQSGVLTMAAELGFDGGPVDLRGEMTVQQVEIVEGTEARGDAFAVDIVHL